MGKWITKAILPLIILAFGIGAGSWLMTHPEKANKRPPIAAKAQPVETGMPESGNFTAHISAMGRVAPALQISLKTQVGGEIIDTADNFVPGGHFKEGDHILTIDPIDYELAVKKQEAVLKEVEADYKLEQGRQDIAKDELDMLTRTTGRKIDKPELALRGPQLEQAQAALDKARTDLDIAKLDLQRTYINAPFNALVTERTANLGNKVSAQETLATMVNTDAYWIMLSVPVNDLQWLDIPESNEDSGSKAVIVMDGGRGTRKGRLLRATGTLDNDTRLAGLIVAVDDPLLLKSKNAGTPLILDDYVQVVIDGRSIDNVMRIPQTWLRDGNIVWVMEADGSLSYRSVEIVFEDHDYTYIKSGISPDDTIVTSDIAVPIEGMKLRPVDVKAQDSDKRGSTE